MNRRVKTGLRVLLLAIVLLLSGLVVVCQRINMGDYIVGKVGRWDDAIFDESVFGP